MKKIFLIEDDYREYEILKYHFAEWDLYYPNILSNRSMVDDDLIDIIYTKITDESLGIVSMIVDIELFKNRNPNVSMDKSGLKIIEAIRNINKDNIIHNKVIPIFCYSKFDHLQIDALKAGSTSFFSKLVLLDPEETRYRFLKQTITALSFIYLDVIKKSLNLYDFAIIEKLLKDIYSSQSEITVSQALILQGLLTVMKYGEFETLVNLPADSDVEDEIIKICGPQVITELKKSKLVRKQKEDIDNMLDDLGDIISPFKPIFKAIKLFSRSMD